MFSQAKLPPANAPITKTAHPMTPASQAARCGGLYRSTNNELIPATAAAATHAAGVRNSHGETISPEVAANPASMRSSEIHLFCHNGQRTKNGATNKSCPLSIAPAASTQPQQNHRFFKAASAAKR